MAIDTAVNLDSRYCSQCKKWRRVPEPAHTWTYCERCGTILIRRGMRRRYAGFWRRAAAYLIDSGVVLALEVVSMLLIPGAGWSDLLFAASASFAILIGLAGVAYIWIGNALGATLGKAPLGLRIVDERGDPPGYRRSLGRYLMSIISGVLMIGYLAMIWDRQKQTWHDHAANTFVVRR